MSLVSSSVSACMVTSAERAQLCVYFTVLQQHLPSVRVPKPYKPTAAGLACKVDLQTKLLAVISWTLSIQWSARDHGYHVQVILHRARAHNL